MSHYSAHGLVVDVPFLRVLLAALVGWLDRQQQEALAYLLEENRVLRGPPAMTPKRCLTPFMRSPLEIVLIDKG